MSTTPGLDPSLISPTRFGTFSKCGLRFRFQYVDGLEPDHSSGSRLFGKVVHKAREQWVTNRRLHMGVLMEDAWDQVGREDPVIGFWLKEYRSLRERAADFLAELRQRRPDLKSPRLSKDWKESTICAELKELQRVAMDEHGHESYYRFTKSDSIADLYDESLTSGKAYQDRWDHLPAALYTELGFNADWRSFRINGFIDSVVPIVSQTDGSFVGYGIEDCKTARKLGLSQKHTNQLGIYRIGIEEMLTRGAVDLDPDQPMYVGVDYWRLLDQQWFSVSDRQLDRLEGELKTYRETVTRRLFLPATTSGECDRCDFAVECSEYHGVERAFEVEEALGLGSVA